MGQRKEPGMDFDLDVFEDVKPVAGDAVEGTIEPSEAEGREAVDVRPGSPYSAIVGALGQGGRVSLLLWGLVLLAVTGIIMLSLWINNVAHSQQSIRRELDLASENIDAIGGALNSQGETILSKGSQTQDKIKFLDSEMRKLWVVSNERNKKWITELQLQVSELDKTNAKLVQNVESSAQQMRIDLKRVEDFTVSHQQSQVAIVALEESMVDLRTLLQANAETMAQLDELVRTFAGNDIEGNMSRLTLQIDDLSKRMATVDAHRRQVNRLLEQLDTEIRALKAQP